MQEGFYYLMYFDTPLRKRNGAYPCLWQVKRNKVLRYHLMEHFTGGVRHYCISYSSLFVNVNTTSISEDELLKILFNNFEDLEFRKEVEYGLVKTMLPSGEYYPNIYRPFLSDFFLDSKINLHYPADVSRVVIADAYYFDEKEYLQHLNQLELLTEGLADVFQFIEPAVSNMDCFGHKIRNLIILACTETESLFKTVMKSNGYVPKKRFTTEDFILVKNPLRLEEYKLRLLSYPAIKKVSPFADWDEKEPTKSLKWYDAYNLLKHDRITHQEYASLQNAVDAICAVAILLIAQYGDKNPFWRDRMQRFFIVDKYPEWDYTDLYIPIDLYPEERKMVKYEFGRK